MNNVLNIFLATIIIFFSSNILAEGFNDNYFQLGFESSDSSVLEKDLYGQIASVERQADGVTKLKIADKITDIRGSISLGQNLSLIGSYATETGKWTDGCACTNFWEKNWDGKSTITSLGIGKNFELGWNVSAAFHIYGAEWSATEIRFYADGEYKGSITQDEAGDLWNTDYMHVWIDNEVFVWEGPPSSSDLPVTFEADYIRVWQK